MWHWRVSAFWEQQNFLFVAEAKRETQWKHRDESTCGRLRSVRSKGKLLPPQRRFRCVKLRTSVLQAVKFSRLGVYDISSGCWVKPWRLSAWKRDTALMGADIFGMTHKQRSYFFPAKLYWREKWKGREKIRTEKTQSVFPMYRTSRLAGIRPDVIAAVLSQNAGSSQSSIWNKKEPTNFQAFAVWPLCHERFPCFLDIEWIVDPRHTWGLLFNFRLRSWANTGPVLSYTAIVVVIIVILVMVIAVVVVIVGVIFVNWGPPPSTPHPNVLSTC